MLLAFFEGAGWQGGVISWPQANGEFVVAFDDGSRFIRAQGCALTNETCVRDYVPLKILSIEDGSVLQKFNHLLHRTKKIEFIEQFNEKLLVKQEGESLNIVDVHSGAITSVSREVLGRTPPELINAAEALGCSLWTMLRHVALPYGRGGIVGGIMLGLGRALGETIAIFFVLKLVYDINWYKIIESEGGSVATLIVATFGEVSGPYELNLLLAAGFFLFVGTLAVNVIANLIVQKTGRSER